MEHHPRYEHPRAPRIVFAGLVGLSYFGQTAARISIFAMMFRTFTWIVIVSLLKWKRQEQAGM
jgi:hypothetical protein